MSVVISLRLPHLSL